MIAMNKHSSSGNVMFLILIAVVLFAALSFAVSSTMRATGSNDSRDTLQLQATELMGFSSSVKTAIERLRVGGCSVYQISFDGPVSGQVRKSPSDMNFAYANPLAPATGACNVFDVRGGNVIFPFISHGIQVPEKLVTGAHNKSNIYFFNGNNQIEDIGTTAGADLLLMAPFITKELCDFINEKNNISGSILASLDTNDNNPFQGVYNQWSAISGAFKGKPSGCIEQSAGNYYFYEVLISR